MIPIKGTGGKVRGYLRECGSRTELLAPGGRVLGYYDSNTNQTIRPGGGFVGYGNVLMTLLED